MNTLLLCMLFIKYYKTMESEVRKLLHHARIGHVSSLISDLIDSQQRSYAFEIQSASKILSTILPDKSVFKKSYFVELCSISLRSCVIDFRFFLEYLVFLSSVRKLHTSLCKCLWRAISYEQTPSISYSLNWRKSFSQVRWAIRQCTEP